MPARGWVPAAGPFAQLQREMDRLFDTVFGKHLARLGRLRPGYVYPPMTVRETADDYTVECELPGLEMDDIELTVTGEELTVSGQRPDVIPEQDVALHRRERDTGRFSRALALPGPVDSSRCEATLRHGVLTVRVPKAEAAKPKRISIRVEPKDETTPKED